MSSDEPPLLELPPLLPPGGPPKPPLKPPPNGGMKPGKPPIIGGLPELEPLELLPDELLDRERLLEDVILIFGCMAIRADCIAAELAPLMSITRTVRFASRAASSSENARASICRNSDSLADTISLLVRASVERVSLIERPC